MELLRDATIYLAAAVVAVPLFRFLGLGAVLGYLAAGIAIGPQALGLVGDPETILHFAEIGVVFLLFVIGLELRPSRLWVLRRAVFGLGALQLSSAAVAIAALLMVLRGSGLADAVVLALALGLSSTAFVLQLLSEKGDLRSPHGRAAFGVLLFQDLAVIPILALLPILGTDPNPTEGDPLWGLLGVLGALFGLVAAGRYLLRPALRIVVHSKTHEIFIAATLLLVLSASLAMVSLGLSMALGAFVAGVILADSEYRHELEASVAPFKGLLLGLFFLSVGMTLDVGLFFQEPLLALGLALVLMLVKAVLLFGAGLAMGVGVGPSRRMALLLCQGGEFAFVILAAAPAYELLNPESARLTTLVVTLSMGLTPLVGLIDERFLAPWLDSDAPDRADEAQPEAHQVIIAGFGRSGQVVARILRARGIDFTALERDPGHLDFVRRFGNTVYFGDAGQLDLLRAAGAGDAKLLVVTVNHAEGSLRIVEMARKHFPQLEIYAAARNRAHALALREIGAKYVMRSTFVSSLELSEAILCGLGAPPERAARTVELFRELDEATLDRQFALHKDDDALVQSARESEEELRLLIEADEEIAAKEQVA